MVRCLGYLGFGVSDFDAWNTFATKVLGLMPGEGLRYRMDSQQDHMTAAATAAIEFAPLLRYTAGSVRGEKTCAPCFGLGRASMSASMPKHSVEQGFADEFDL